MYMLVVATGPDYVLVVWSTDGCITAALKAVAQQPTHSARTSLPLGTVGG